MLALGIVARAFDLVAIAIFSKIGKGLPSSSKNIVNFAGALPRLVELPLKFGLLFFAALAFGAKQFHLLHLIFALPEEIGIFRFDGCPLRGKRRRAGE